MTFLEIQAAELADNPFMDPCDAIQLLLALSPETTNIEARRLYAAAVAAHIPEPEPLPDAELPPPIPESQMFDRFCATHPLTPEFYELRRMLTLNAASV